MRSVKRSRLEACTKAGAGTVTFKVATVDGWQYVTGTLAPVAPHIQCAQFAVHRAIGHDGWTVSSVVGGGHVCDVHESAKSAKSAAVEALFGRSDMEVERGIRTLRERMAQAGV